MADWFAASDSDGPPEALGVFPQACGEVLDSRCFYGKEVLLDDGCPDGANVRVGTQDGNEVGIAIPCVINFPDKPLQPKADSRGGVLHSLRVFQYPEALVGILHGGGPIGIRGNWQKGNLQWGWRDYFRMVTCPVE